MQFFSFTCFFNKGVIPGVWGSIKTGNPYPITLAIVEKEKMAPSIDMFFSSIEQARELVKALDDKINELCAEQPKTAEEE